MKLKFSAPYLFVGLTLLPVINNPKSHATTSNNFSKHANTVKQNLLKNSVTPADKTRYSYNAPVYDYQPNTISYMDAISDSDFPMAYNQPRQDNHVPPFNDTHITTYEKNYTDMVLDQKADQLCNIYIQNMSMAQQKLNPLLGKRGYASAVRRELPGAPVGQHCVFGQYTQLNRALKELGDTLNIVPVAGSHSCLMFRETMRKKYTADNGFENCLYNGTMYESDSAYNIALNKYLRSKKVSTDTSNADYQKHVEQFSRNNFSVERLKPGTMLVVPRYHGSKSLSHMIMLLGRGKIEQGKFIPDPNGRYVYIAHNTERIGYLFEQWDARNVFAANTWQIARTLYEQELNTLNQMSKQDLINFLTDFGGITPEGLDALSTIELQQLACDKYLNDLPKLQQDYLCATIYRFVYPKNNQCPLNTLFANNKTR